MYALIGLNPFPRWLIPNEPIYIFFVVSTFIISLNIKLVKNRYRWYAFCSMIAYICYITLPVFEIYSFRVGHFLWYMPLLAILFYESWIHNEAFKKLKTIITFLSFCSILVWFIRTLGFSLPYFEIYNNAKPDCVYRLYGLVLSIYRHGAPIQTGTGGIERVCGPFAEPGHFAIILGMVLLLSNMNFENKGNRIMLTAGLLTFSPVFYFLMFIGLLYRLTNAKKIGTSTFHIAIFMVLFIVIVSSNTYIGDQIRYVAYERHFGGKQNPIEVLDDRVTEQFMIIYNHFLLSGPVFTGYGFESGAVTDFIPSNYRSYIYKFGYIGVVIWLIFAISLFSNLDKIKFTVFMIAFISVMAHRYQFALYPAVYILIVLGLEKKNIDYLS